MNSIIKTAHANVTEVAYLNPGGEGDKRERPEIVAELVRKLMRQL